MRDGGSSLNEGRRRRSQSGSGFWREGERRVAMAVAAGWLSMGNRVLKVETDFMNLGQFIDRTLQSQKLGLSNKAKQGGRLQTYIYT